MIRRRTALAAAAVLTALVACARGTPVGTDVIDGSYSITGMRWSSSVISAVAVKLREENGVAIVCGAFILEGENVSTGEIDAVVRSAGAIRHGDRQLLRGLYGLAGPYDSVDGLEGRAARCVDTGVAWRPEFANRSALRLVTPRRVTL